MRTLRRGLYIFVSRRQNDTHMTPETARGALFTCFLFRGVNSFDVGAQAAAGVRMTSPPRKRARMGHEEGDDEGVAKSHVQSLEAVAVDLGDLFAPPASSSSSTSSAGVSSTSASSPHTFRLIDHRAGVQGAALPQFVGEERLLIFRSDRAGAIAKLIYSFVDGDDADETDGGDGEQSDRARRAKIHALECKPDYRGHDFGGLLFTEAVNYMRRRVGTDLALVRCELDAEEDQRRHSKLIEFYSELGCSVKVKAKARIIHNNDGESYRKIPMFLDICPGADDIDHRHSARSLGSMDRFLPVIFVKANGQYLQVSAEDDDKCDLKRRAAHWLLVQDDDNNIEIRNTVGDGLHVDAESGLSTIRPPVSKSNQRATKFQLLRISEEDNGNSLDCGCKDISSLWMIRSVEYGTYLTAAADAAVLRCTAIPSFWLTGPAYSLVHTTESPAQRHHYRRQWQTQCVRYVEKMRARYLPCHSRRMTLRQALDAVRAIPADPWSAAEASHRAISVRTLCLRTAEHFRAAGHPDWIQLLALLYGLGKAGQRDDDDDCGTYDWTVCSRSRVVGCPVPNQVVYANYQVLDPDGGNTLYNSSATGMYEQHCGLDNVLLSWTGPEYLYYMLRQNLVGIPDDALKMLRLASLSVWHSTASLDRTTLAYAVICSDDDFALQSLVSDFDRALHEARTKSPRGPELTGDECDSLWSAYYADVAAKYNCAGLLEW